MSGWCAQNSANILGISPRATLSMVAIATVPRRRPCNSLIFDDARFSSAVLTRA
jgi:hypothetical protein